MCQSSDIFKVYYPIIQIIYFLSDMAKSVYIKIIKYKDYSIGKQQKSRTSTMIQKDIRTGNKKIKKICLKGLIIPIKSEKQSKTTKQQRIQHTHSSSQQQQQYEANLQIGLQKVVKQLLGRHISYQVLQLKQSDIANQLAYYQSGYVECVDLVLKVTFQNSHDLHVFESAVNKIKHNQSKTKVQDRQNEKKIQKIKGKTKNRNKVLKLQQFIKLKSDVKQQTKQTQQIDNNQQDEQQEMSDQHYAYEQQSESSDEDQQANEQDSIMQTHSMLKTGQSSDISFNFKDNSSLAELSNCKKEDSRKSKKDRLKMRTTNVNNSDKSSSKQDRHSYHSYGQIEENQNEINNTLQNIQGNEHKHKQNNKHRRKQMEDRSKIYSFGYQKPVILFILATLIITIVFWGRFNTPSAHQQTKNVKQIRVQTNGSYTPFYGQIEQQITPKTYFIPDNILKPGEIFFLYAKQLPSVNNIYQSLHPRKLPYIRPTITQLITLPHIQYTTSYSKQLKILNLTYSGEQLDNYIDQLSKKYNISRSHALYNEIYTRPLEAKVQQAQYYYLSQKYSYLGGMQKHGEKYMCIVSYGHDQYESKQFIPFFRSVLSQNYSNYRLIYIDDGSTDFYDLDKTIYYLYHNFKEDISRVGTNNFLFLKNYLKIGKVLSKNAAVRELCHDGDIVVQLDASNQLIGRQSLRLLSLQYDPQIKAAKNPDNKFNKDNGNDNKNKGRQNMGSNIGQNKNLNKIKDNNMARKYQLPSQARQQNYGNMSKIWLVSNNYLQISAQAQTESATQQMHTRQIQIKEKLSKSHSWWQMLQQSKSLMQIKNRLQENKEELFSNCFISYTIELQAKVPYHQLVDQSDKFIQSKQYTQNIYNYLSLLELSGQFIKQDGKYSHSAYVQQPICLYKNRKNIQNSPCKKKKKLYEQFKALSRNSLAKLNQLQGQSTITIIESEFINNEDYNVVTNSLKNQYQVACRNQFILNN